MALPAQSTPGFVTGQVPTAAGWNEPFAGKLDIANVGAANGVAPLDENGLVPTANLPTNYPVETGTIFGDFTTVNASPVTIPNLPTIPLAGGKVSLQGQIGAYDVSTGDTATWHPAVCRHRYSAHASGEHAGADHYGRRPVGGPCDLRLQFLVHRILHRLIRTPPMKLALLGALTFELTHCP